MQCLTHTRTDPMVAATIVVACLSLFSVQFSCSGVSDFLRPVGKNWCHFGLFSFPKARAKGTWLRHPATAPHPQPRIQEPLQA